MELKSESAQEVKIFVGPCEIAGYYLNLANGLKSLGHDCDYVSFLPHPFKYESETSGHLLVRLITGINNIGISPARPFVIKLVQFALTEFLSFFYLCICLFRYDVFIFGFGKSIMRKNIDLPILKFLGKKIIMNMAHGSDLRPPYIDGSYQSPDGSKQPTTLSLCRNSRRYRKKIVFIEKYVDYVIGAPFSSTYFSEKKLINTFDIGLPYKGPSSTTHAGDRIQSESIALNPDPKSNVIRVLHSPSHPAAKGSFIVRESIQRLLSKGYRIDFIEVCNRPNVEVLEEIRRCDFVVDQAYSDTPMAGFAAEAAWFGKPAVVGGYGFDYLKRFMAQDMFPPSQTCRPERIESAIEELIVNAELRQKLGAEARAFVHNQWTIEKVAERYLRIIKDDIPDDWWLDPKEVVYVHGAGQPEGRTKDNIRKMVESYGVKSLQLSHRPDLEKAFLEFAGLDPR